MVAIIVLNWNGWLDTVECLESLQRLSYPNYRIVVVDNGSTDDSVHKIRAWAASELPVGSAFFNYDASTKPVHTIEYDQPTAEAGGRQEIEDQIKGVSGSRHMVIIQTGANLGFAGGNNVAIKYSLKRASYVWLVNNDTVVDRDALSEMVELAEKSSGVGMVGSKLLSYDRPKRIQMLGGAKIGPLYALGYPVLGSGEEDRGQWDSIRELDFVNGASLLAKCEALNEVGLMDESYFLYSEDADWCVRAKRNGWKLLYCPRSLVFHKGSKSVKERSPQQDYYLSLNYLFLFKKFYPGLIPLVLFRIVIRILKRSLRMEWRNTKAILDALWDFLRNKQGGYRLSKYG